MISRIDEQIFIGTYLDADNHRLLKQLRIKYILDLGWAESHPHPTFRYLWNLIWPVPPEGNLDPEKLVSAIRYIDEAVRNGSRILVHCGGGVDRAPFIVALYYHFFKDDLLSVAYEKILRKRKIAKPHNWLTSELAMELKRRLGYK